MEHQAPLLLDQPSIKAANGIFIHDDSNPRVAVVHIFGEATFADVNDLESVVVCAIRIGRPVVLDLFECSYLDCAALSVIVRAAKNLGPLLRLAVPAESQCYRMLELVGLGHALNIYTSLDDAMSPPSTELVGALRSV
jgi:anti-anti-sigma factor